MALILEVTHHDGTRTRHWLNGEPLTIGRGLANHVIVDDPYVDANHVRVTPGNGDGAVVEDLGSVNGLVAGAQRLVGPSVVRPGDVLRLGRTTMRFRDTNEVVSPALIDSQAVSVVAPEPRTRLRFPTTTWARLGIALLAVITVGIDAWLGHTGRSAASEAVSTTLGAGMVLAVWAGLWSIASRIIVHQFRFVGHLALASAAVLSATLWGIMQSWLNFIFPDAGLLSVAGYVAAAALLAALVAGHLSFASTLPRRRLVRVGIIAAATVMGITLITELSKDDTFSDVPKYPAILKPIAAGLVPTKSIDQFEASTRDIKDQVDRLAKK